MDYGWDASGISQANTEYLRRHLRVEKTLSLWIVDHSDTGRSDKSLLDILALGRLGTSLGSLREGLLLGWMLVFSSREVSDRFQSLRTMSSFEHLLCWKTVWSPVRFSVVNRSVDANELRITMMTMLYIAIEYSIGPKCTYSKWFEWETLHADSW